jgi:hypothetical protein
MASINDEAKGIGPVDGKKVAPRRLRESLFCFVIDLADEPDLSTVGSQYLRV